MNEFTIWDKKDRIFISKEDASFIECGSYSSIITDIIDKNTDRYQLFKGIGIKDINNRSIYAESSILEFANMKNNKKYYAFLKFDVYWQRMFFWFVQDCNDNKAFGYAGKKLDRVEYTPDIMHKLKVIDTVQENKLGLIK